MCDYFAHKVTNFFPVSGDWKQQKWTRLQFKKHRNLDWKSLPRCLPRLLSRDADTKMSEKSLDKKLEKQNVLDALDNQLEQL